MKKVLPFFVHFWLIIALAGCAGVAKDKINLPGYSGLKARIAVADFQVNADKAVKEIGLDLRGMLVTTLANSNRFIIVEQKEPPDSQAKPADSMIYAAVSEFEPQASGGRAGLGGGGGVDSGLMGGLLGSTLNKAHISLDIRIVDTLTSAVLSATRVQGQSQETAAASKGQGLGLDLSGYVNTPMEKAIRECVIEASRYISQSIPADYYKY